MNLKNYSKRSARIQDSSEDYSSWKVEAVGEGEVRDLFDFIRKEGSNLDKEFVKKVYKAFPDMPASVKILRGGVRGFGDAQALEPYSNDIFSCVTTFGGAKLVVVEIWRRGNGC